MEHYEILDRADQLQVLRNGLLGQYGQPAHMYMTSARFRQKIDLLAEMLPAMVEGLMKEAFEQDRLFDLEVIKETLVARTKFRIRKAIPTLIIFQRSVNQMKVDIKFKHDWSFRLFMLCLVFICSLPFTFMGMLLVSDSPFWMWQSIFMFFAAILMLEKK